MQKHGFTLIELIATMAVMAVVMGTAVVMLVQLIGFQRNHDEQANQLRNADRFAAAFREDVHAYGKPVILMEDNTLLRWKTETETIEYVMKPGRFPHQRNIVRTVHRDGQQSHCETYRLPDRTTLWFVDGKDNDAGLVALCLWTSPPHAEPPKIDAFNPFDRTIQNPPEERIDPKYACWRTIIARY
jgi:prepilin-type N-terminal cleavage/methylation domain-containing protein